MYKENDYSPSYLRTKDDVEIDLVIERPGMPTALVEIKSSASIREQDIQKLSHIAKDISNSEA